MREAYRATVADRRSAGRKKRERERWRQPITGAPQVARRARQIDPMRTAPVCFVIESSRARRQISPLPLAGEGWVEGRPQVQGIESWPSPGASRHLVPQAGEGVPRRKIDDSDD